tara:strand:+ start:260 stop:409 length:150 start_codon:yes stop_codon:yes gene_type:complete
MIEMICKVGVLCDSGEPEWFIIAILGGALAALIWIEILVVKKIVAKRRS